MMSDLLGARLQTLKLADDLQGAISILWELLWTLSPPHITGAQPTDLSTITEPWPKSVRSLVRKVCFDRPRLAF